MRVDLHCHSKWSKRPALWLMQKISKRPVNYIFPGLAVS